MTLVRPSYANVTATLALVVALSGTAYAAGLPKHSVGTKQLKKNAVTSATVKDGAITSADVADQGIEPGDLSAASKALAAAGPASPTLLSGGAHDLEISSGDPLVGYGPVSGNAAASSAVASTAGLSPSRAVTVGNLQVRVGKPLSDIKTLRVDVVASASLADDASAVTLLSCTVPGGGAITCASNATAALPAASFVYVRLLTDAQFSGGQAEIMDVVAYSMTLTPA